MDIKITPEDERRWRAIDDIVNRLLRADSEAELRAAECPVCRSPLAFAVHPKKQLFFVRCTASSVHVAKHVEAEKLPAWMDEFVSDGWYSTNA